MAQALLLCSSCFLKPLAARFSLVILNSRPVFISRYAFLISLGGSCFAWRASRVLDVIHSLWLRHGLTSESKSGIHNLFVPYPLLCWTWTTSLRIKGKLLRRRFLTLFVDTSET
ncbi:hypothetical protein V6Z77_000739 [Aspergillus fumigatus]